MIDKSSQVAPTALPAAQPLVWLTDKEKAILRWVLCGDAFREKAPGAAGRAARIESLRRLRDKGLLRLNQDELWKVTRYGRLVLEGMSKKR